MIILSSICVAGTSSYLLLNKIDFILDESFTSSLIYLSSTLRMDSSISTSIISSDVALISLTRGSLAIKSTNALRFALDAESPLETFISFKAF